MHIAYIAPYQGPALVERRPIVRNLSLAGRVKVERIAELLLAAGHRVEILSQGEVVEQRLRVYPSFDEPDSFASEIPIRYSSALPIRGVNGLWSSWDTVREFERRHRADPFDIVLIYNLKPPQVACAKRAMELGLPVVLEYEDGYFGKGQSERKRGRFSPDYHGKGAKRVLGQVAGAIGVSPDLLAETPSGVPKFLLRGVVSGEVVERNGKSMDARENWVVYSGTHFRAYGLEELVEAWRSTDAPGWQLHIAGQGELTDRLHRLAEGDSTIVFRGLLGRRENAELLGTAKIGINAHDTDHTEGNYFAFKIIEYLAAGLHVVTTRMGDLPPEIDAGITYMDNNRAGTIAETLGSVIRGNGFTRTAVDGALAHFGSDAVAMSLDHLLSAVTATGDG